jgi:hypothetical protein
MQLRKGAAPALHDSNGAGPEVVRSSALTVTAPIGEIAEAPRELRWQPVSTAVRYQTRLSEVDRTPIWMQETTASVLELPDEIRTRIVPGKTILFEVVALDSTGARIAASGPVRFRVAPKIH